MPYMTNADYIFVGREKESWCLSEAILSRQSLMIAGAKEVGKTALIQNVISELPPSTRKRCLHIGTFRDLHDLLERIVTRLYEAGDARLKSEFRTAGITKVNLASQMGCLSSSRLRGMLYRVVQGNGYRIILDHCPALTPSVARVIKELFWMRQTPVYRVPSGAVEAEIARAGRFFYWTDQQILRLGPLPVGAARKLIEHCIQEYGLEGLELDGFPEEVLELSHRVPGVIVAICRMAANPRYHFNSRVKTKLIQIDYIMRGSATHAAPTRVSRHS
jgi:hypothetical protein